MPAEVLAISWSSGRDGGNISPPWQGQPAQTPVQLPTNSLPLCSLLLGQAEPNREASRGQVPGPGGKLGVLRAMGCPGDTSDGPARLPGTWLIPGLEINSGISWLRGQLGACSHGRALVFS